MMMVVGVWLLLLLLKMLLKMLLVGVIVTVSLSRQRQDTAVANEIVDSGARERLKMMWLKLMMMMTELLLLLLHGMMHYYCSVYRLHVIAI